MRRSWSVLPAAPCLLIAFALTGPAARAEVAVTILPGASDNIYPNTSTTHGWEFTLEGPIEITHLGLYDRFQDGFALDHPIGLWDEDDTLLASVTISAGAGDTLIDDFRYVEIAGGPVTLTPGEMYTIGFFTEVFLQQDGMVIFDGFHTIHPTIIYKGRGVSDMTVGLQKPTTQDEFGSHRWGPNFQFTPACPWDLDGDGEIGVVDLLTVLGQWGTDPGGPPDFDGDGDVGVTDLLKVLALWGPC